MDVVLPGPRVCCHTERGRASTSGMRTFVLGATLATILGCSDDASHHLPPETGIDEAPAALTNQAHVRITFHANGIANRFICQLDGGGPTTCISPFESDVSDGDHT